jgi:hypothetical protein
MNKKEYIITLKNIDSKKEFCKEMKNEISISCDIPKRACECVDERPISRNTHFLLTNEEADGLKNDDRVLSIEEIDPNVRPVPQGFKSSLNRKIYGQKEEQEVKIQYTGDRFGYTSFEKQGENVDVVVVDGHINPAHPEFARNIDGSGGTRVRQINWFQFGGTGTYSYTPYVDANNNDLTDENDHGMHVGGIVAGNRQGWARKSDIYNINPYRNQFWRIFDYLRGWHNSKAINPKTGYKNPTIVNNSWGFERTDVYFTNVTKVVYRGTTYNAPVGGFSKTDLSSKGIIMWGAGTRSGYLTNTPYFYSSVDADIADCINDGMVFVGAAGNSYLKIDLPTGADYNNYFNVSGSNVNYYYHRGGTPGSSPNVISVGSMDINDYKSNFSNCGPSVTLYAAGSNIISSIHDSTFRSISAVTDPRNSAYYLDKYSGTSMASPQVAGIIAASAENWPAEHNGATINQSSALNFLSDNWKKDRLITTNTTDTYSDTRSLQGSPNRRVFYPYSTYIEINNT